MLIVGIRSHVNGIRLASNAQRLVVILANVMYHLKNTIKHVHTCLIVIT